MGPEVVKDSFNSSSTHRRFALRGNVSTCIWCHGFKFELCKGLNWKLEMHSLAWTCAKPYLDRMAEASLDQLLSEHFGPEVAAEGPQQKLYPSLAAYKSAGRPWEAPRGLTFTGRFLSHCHISLCFYSKSSPSSEGRRCVFADGRRAVGVGVELLKWIQIRRSSCQRPGPAGFEVLTPGFGMLHAESVARLLTVTLGGVRPEAELTGLLPALHTSLLRRCMQEARTCWAKLCTATGSLSTTGLTQTFNDSIKFRQRQRMDLRLQRVGRSGLGCRKRSACNHSRATCM